MNKDLLNDAPYDVLLEQALRLQAELETDTKRAIVGPLEAEGFELAPFAGAFRRAVERAGDLLADQAEHLDLSATEGVALSAAVAKARSWLQSTEFRAEALARQDHNLGDTLLTTFRLNPVPPSGAAWKDVFVLLQKVRRKLDAQERRPLPGLPAAFQAQVDLLQAALLSALRGDERAETLVEGTTAALLDAREDLIDNCLRYLGMLAIVNHDREATGEGPLPGGNLETVRQWAATRPGVIAAREAAGAPAQ